MSRIVVALGGNALLHRGERAEAAISGRTPATPALPSPHERRRTGS